MGWPILMRFSIAMPKVRARSLRRAPAIVLARAYLMVLLGMITTPG